MSLVDRLRRQTHPSPEHVSPVATSAPKEEKRELAHPDMIDVSSHPLRTYPGFDSYTTDWNSHVLGSTRFFLSRRVEDATRRKAQAESMYSELLTHAEEEVRKREEQVGKARVIYEADPRRFAPKRERDRDWRKAKDKVRNAHARIDSLPAERDEALAHANKVLGIRSQDLENNDIEFALEWVDSGRLSVDRVVFFAALHFSEDEEKVDGLFERYSRERNMDLIDLREVNVNYKLVMRNLKGDELAFDDAWDKAAEDAQRQRPDLKASSHGDVPTDETL